MITHIFVKGVQTTNEIINECRRNKYVANKSKQKDMYKVLVLNNQVLFSYLKPVYLATIYEFARSNCDFDGGYLSDKIILDAIKYKISKKQLGLGIIKDDSIKYIADDSRKCYIKTGRRATHLILSDNKYDCFVYMDELKTYFTENIDKAKNIQYSENKIKQIII